MNDALEPALGKRSTMKLLLPEADDLSWHGQGHLVFHPQAHLAHLAAISKATNTQQVLVPP